MLLRLANSLRKNGRENENLQMVSAILRVEENNVADKLWARKTRKLR